VYVGDAEKLTEDQLPDLLKPLASIQSYELRDNYWNDDVAGLISKLKGKNISADEVRFPKQVGRYLPDFLGPVKIQEMMACLPDWTLREYELEDGPSKGNRGEAYSVVPGFAGFGAADRA
jgi:hypothetical protein